MFTLIFIPCVTGLIPHRVTPCRNGSLLLYSQSHQGRVPEITRSHQCRVPDITVISDSALGKASVTLRPKEQIIKVCTGVEARAIRVQGGNARVQGGHSTNPRVHSTTARVHGRHARAHGLITSVHYCPTLDLKDGLVVGNCLYCLHFSHWVRLDFLLF